jgi:hypothetical protein
MHSLWRGPVPTPLTQAVFLNRVREFIMRLEPTVTHSTHGFYRTESRYSNFSATTCIDCAGGKSDEDSDAATPCVTCGPGEYTAAGTMGLCGTTSGSFHTFVIRLELVVNFESTVVYHDV